MPDPPRYVEATVRETSLSLAVTVVDAYTGTTPTGPVGVRLRESKTTLERHPSGSWLLVGVDLPPNPFTVVVDGGTRYLSTTYPVAVTEDEEGNGDDGDAIDFPEGTQELSASSPVLEVRLAPSLAYPFPSGATLVRGVLREPAEQSSSVGVGVSSEETHGKEGVTLRLDGIDVGTTESPRPIQTTTTETGEFVLWVAFESNVTVDRPLETVQVINPVTGDAEDEDVRLQRVNVDGADPTIVATHDDLSGDEDARSVSLPVEPGTTTFVELAVEGGGVVVDDAV